MTDFVKETPRTRLKRYHERGDHSRAGIYAILDEGLICHMGFVVDGQPFVIPTAYARHEDQLYLHGSAASRALRTLSTGVPVCVTVTLTDGIVLARSAFNHSFNYRSVVVLGVATPVDDPDEKELALSRFTDRLVPGRWEDVRKPTPLELKATSLLTLPIDEASAKIRTGPPGDDEVDLAHPCWAGVIPLGMEAGTPIPAVDLSADQQTPDYVSDFISARKARTSTDGRASS
jgi:nitroimidazol reductase NimA-like FMN-containing flavoprotein (pyridoxamine 5'-phosphate oxidase superfamily)